MAQWEKWKEEKQKRRKKESSEKNGKIYNEGKQGKKLLVKINCFLF